MKTTIVFLLGVIFLGLVLLAAPEGLFAQQVTTQKNSEQRLLWENTHPY